MNNTVTKVNGHEYTTEFYRSYNFRRLRNEWRWKITAANNKRIAASTESYVNRKDCEDNYFLIGAVVKITEL